MNQSERFASENRVLREEQDTLRRQLAHLETVAVDLFWSLASVEDWKTFAPSGITNDIYNNPAQYLEKVLGFGESARRSVLTSWKMAQQMDGCESWKVAIITFLRGHKEVCTEAREEIATSIILKGDAEKPIPQIVEYAGWIAEHAEEILALPLPPAWREEVEMRVEIMKQPAGHKWWEGSVAIDLETLKNNGTIPEDVYADLMTCVWKTGNHWATDWPEEQVSSRTSEWVRENSDLLEYMEFPPRWIEYMNKEEEKDES